MNKLIYQVKIGPKSNLYEWCTNSVKDYANKIGADYYCQTVPKLFIKPNPYTTNRSKEAVSKFNCLPIFEKENAFDLLHEYDQIAIIDADVYVRDNSTSIFDELPLEYSFGAVVERDMPITEQYKNKIRNYSSMQFMQLHGNTADFSPNELGYEFMNMGVMVINKSLLKHFKGMTAKEWLSQPRFQDFVDGKGNWKWSTDQVLLNTWIRTAGVKYKGLHWKWNGLYSVNNKLKECNFVHFFLRDKLPNRGENIHQLQESIS